MTVVLPTTPDIIVYWQTWFDSGTDKVFELTSPNDIDSVAEDNSWKQKPPFPKTQDSSLCATPIPPIVTLSDSGPA